MANSNGTFLSRCSYHYHGKSAFPLPTDNEQICQTIISRRADDTATCLAIETALGERNELRIEKTMAILRVGDRRRRHNDRHLAVPNLLHYNTLAQYNRGQLLNQYRYLFRYSGVAYENNTVTLSACTIKADCVQHA